MSWVSQGADETPQTSGDDPYAPHAVMPSGPNEGKLLDTREKRSVVILSEQEAAPYQTRKGDTVLANFFHEGRFWIAVVPKNAVAQVYFHRESMTPVPSNHAQLRFQFKPGREATLYPQKSGPPKAKDAVKVADLIYSVEALTKMGDVYDAKRGLSNNFGLAHRVTSAKESYYSGIFVNDDYIEQIPLRLTNPERQSVLRAALQRSNDSAYGEMYHLLCNSCMSQAFETLDGSLQYAPLGRVAASLKRLPWFPRTYLWMRGLIPTSVLLKNTTPTFGEEFKELHDDPQFPLRAEHDVKRAEIDRTEAKTAADAKSCAKHNAALAGTSKTSRHR